MKTNPNNLPESYDECPTNDFEAGEPNGVCWSDGHHLCQGCKNLRKDFHGNEGIIKREIYMRPIPFTISTL